MKIVAVENKHDTVYNKGVRLTGTANDILSRISERSGLPNQVIADRAVRLLAMLSEDTQGIIIGELPMRRRPEFARQLLEELAAQDVSEPAGKIGRTETPGQSEKQAAKTDPGKDKPDNDPPKRTRKTHF